MTLINNGIPLPDAHGFPLTTCGNDVDDEASTIKCGAAMTIMKPQYLNEELTVQFEKFEARQWGDELFHGWETEIGYTIVFDEELRSWTYAELVDGTLVSSKAVVEPDDTKSDVQNMLPSITPSLRPEKTLDLSLRDMMKTTFEINEQMAAPITGTNNVLVILANFNDTSTTYDASDFNSLLFGSGSYSMKDYYNEASYGNFTVSAGPGGIAGWYGASNTHNYYGTNDSIGRDKWPGDFVYDAVHAADLAGFNFAPYDMNGDCYVDVVTIVHQGTGEEASGLSTDIWSHRWNLSSAYYYSYSHYGVYTTNSDCPSGGKIKVNDYTIQPEILFSSMQTIGVFTHEYGHALGLPDLYDTDYTSSGIGDWSLMAGGSWNYVSKHGDRPAHLDAWSKNELGWITPTLVTGTLSNETITSANSASDVYKFLTGNEYFLVENRQKAGFDTGLPGAGLLIWHIDDSMPSNDNECYPGGVSCSTTHYKVALVQADNLWHLEKEINQGDGGDPYPGSTNNTAFTELSSPESNLYNGSSSDVSITNISSSGTNMTATLAYGSTTTYTLTENNAGTGVGTVTSQPAGINCGSTCSASFNSGTTVILTAQAEASSTFAGWSGACTGTGTCQVTMNNNVSVTATFNQLTGEPNVWFDPETLTVLTNRAFNIETHLNSGTQELGAYQFMITFDNSLINVDTSEGTGIEPGADGFITSVNIDNDSGTIKVNGYDYNGTGPGSDLVVLILHLKTLDVTLNDSVNTHIGLTVDYLSDQENIIIPPALGKGADVTIEPVLCGDVNDNGEVNIGDALFIARYSVELPVSNFVEAAADVNCDNSINIGDALNIARHSVELPVTNWCCD